MKLVAIKGFPIYSFLWTVNLKSFEITVSTATPVMFAKWTVNLKSFEIDLVVNNIGNNLDEL